MRLAAGGRPIAKSSGDVSESSKLMSKLKRKANAAKIIRVGDRKQEWHPKKKFKFKSITPQKRR
jgi:hypothetical protein